MPLVSVVMASYNHEKYISEAIESILNQSFEDLEFIIIDDASKDNSQQIIKCYQNKDYRIRTFFHEQNKGISTTYNELLTKSKGKYVAFFASDDVWSKDKLKEQINILKNNEDLVVWSDGLIIDSFGNSKGKLLSQVHIFNKFKKSGYIFQELILKTNFIFASSIITKREFFDDIKFNENLKYLHDYKVVLDLAKNHEYYFIPKPLAYYRIHGKNTDNSDEKGLNLNNIECGRMLLDEYGDTLSNYIKNFILLDISKNYYKLGQKKKAIKNVTSALSKPREYNIIYLIAAFITHITKIARYRFNFHIK